MMQETKAQQYRGVMCGYCRQPIPVSGTIDRMVREHTDEDTQEVRPRVFNLRCRACEKEKQYRISDIVEFEGSPRPRSMRTRVPLMRHEPKVARAAHG
jgi:L-lactate utilization protein LutB